MSWLIFVFLAIVILDMVGQALRALSGSLREDMVNLGAGIFQVDEMANRLDEPEKSAVKAMLASPKEKLEEAKTRASQWATHGIAPTEERQKLRAELKAAMATVAAARQRALKSLPQDEEDDDD